MQYQEIKLSTKTYRAVSTQFPPIDLFENLCAPEDYEQACLWETYTNDRVRNTLIPHEKCVFGQGASYVMAPFFYKTPPARFSTQWFGGYYAATDEVTAIYEKSYHLGNFIAATEAEAFSDGLMVQMLKGSVNTVVYDLTTLPLSHPIYHKTSYEESQNTAEILFDMDSHGILYRSVRNEGKKCVVIFTPKQVKIPIITKKIPLHFDGQKIDKFFDREKWQKILLSSP